MSTIYDFDEKNAYESIEIHYFNDGWDMEGLMEDGTVTLWVRPAGFDGDVESVQDVFVGKSKTFIVSEDNGDLVIGEMPTYRFKEEWAEKIWAKFRRDNYTHICPKCGEKMAHSVAGQTMSDIGRIEQFHCDGCHYTWIGYPSSKFIREGVLHSSWDVR